jgi:hypothetical protein
MYSSWFKNDENSELPPGRSSNAGTIWFVSMCLVSFLLVGVAVFIPDPGIYIALCGLPLAAIVFTLWLLRLLSII